MTKTALLALALLGAAAVAQPQGSVLWSHPGTDGIYSVIAIGDVDDDSLPEVVGAIYYANYPSDERKVYCLSGATGDTIWISRESYGTWGNKGLARTADISGDGHDDVLLGTVGTYIPPGRSCVAIDGATGDNLWVFPFGQERGWCYAVYPFLAPDGGQVDLDGDSVPDVLAGAGGVTSDRRGTAVALSGGTGDSLWAFRPDYDGCQGLAPFVDVNGDTVPEVLVAAGGNGLDNRAFCVSGRTGSVLWSYETDNSVSDIERIADVNNSGTDDCIAAGWDSATVFCLEGSSGDSIWATKIPAGGVVMEVVPIRDTNGDSVADVVVGSWASEVYVLSGMDGSTLWSDYMGANVWSVDTLADVTGDGTPEVVAGCHANGSGVVKVFDGTDGNVLWYYNFSERVYDVSGVPDLDGDDVADVAVGLQDHGNQADHLYAFSGLPPSAAAEPVLAPTGSARLLAFDPAARRLDLAVPPGVDFELRLVDATGRQSGNSIAGTGSVALPLARFGRLAAGNYFARVRLSNGRSAVTKITLYTGTGK